MPTRTRPNTPRRTQLPSQFRPHPWHGLDPGAEAPEVVDAFIEMTPFDLTQMSSGSPSPCVPRAPSALTRAPQ